MISRMTLTRLIVAATALAGCRFEMREEEARAHFARASCDVAARCSGASDLLELCRAGFSAAAVRPLGWPVRDAAYQRAIEEGRLRFDGFRAVRCVDKVAALSCAAASNDEWLLLDDDCRFYRGTQLDFGDCTHQEECVDGLECVRSGRTCPGVCIPDAGLPGNRLATPDAPCLGPTVRTTLVCPAGQQCERIGEDGGSRCGAIASVGERCNPRRCPFGAFCDPETFRCEPLRREGEPCGKAVSGFTPAQGQMSVRAGVLGPNRRSRASEVHPASRGRRRLRNTARFGPETTNLPAAAQVREALGLSLYGRCRGRRSMH